MNPIPSDATALLTDEATERRPPMVPAWATPAAILVLLAPTLEWFVRRLDDGSEEPLGLVSLAAAGVFALRERGHGGPSSGSRWTGAALFLTAIITDPFVPPMVRAALLLTGCLAWFGMLRHAGITGLVLLSLPVVASLQFYAGYPLRRGTTELAVQLLRFCGAVSSADGVNLILGGETVSVDPACAGIRMAWHALAACMALAAIHRTSWRTTTAAGLLTAALLVPANSIRAAWLAMVETGRLVDPGLGHGGIGIVCFVVLLVPLWAFVSRNARPKPQASGPAAGAPGARWIVWLAALLSPFAAMLARQETEAFLPGRAPTEFTFHGTTLPLEPLPATEIETGFAKSFPGTLGSYRWGGGQLILRRVNKATRQLHPSRDCLRAAGFDTSEAVTVRCSDGGTWSKFRAYRDGMEYTVHERIVSERDGSTWTDAPAWFWDALRHPLNGPWRAETLISP